MVEPGATAAVRAKSLNWALLAIARIKPVEGWSATIALRLNVTSSRVVAAAAPAVCVSMGDPGRVAVLLTTVPVSFRRYNPGRRR